MEAEFLRNYINVILNVLGYHDFSSEFVESLVFYDIYAKIAIVSGSLENLLKCRIIVFLKRLGASVLKSRPRKCSIW